MMPLRENGLDRDRKIGESFHNFAEEKSRGAFPFTVQCRWSLVLILCASCQMRPSNNLAPSEPERAKVAVSYPAAEKIVRDKKSILELQEWLQDVNATQLVLMRSATVLSRKIPKTAELRTQKKSLYHKERKDHKEQNSQTPHIFIDLTNA